MYLFVFCMAVCFFAFDRFVSKHHLVKSSQQALVQQKLVSEPMHRGTYVVAMVVMSLSM